MRKNKAKRKQTKCEIEIKNNLYIFPTEVTGFFGGKNDPDPLRLNNFKQFKSNCFEVAMKTGTKVMSFDFELTGRNFVTCFFEIDGHSTYSLLNAYYPLVTLASSVEAFDINFIENQVLLKELGCFYKVLTCKELSWPVTKEMLVNLNQAELEQVKYFKPETLGKLLFNFWD